MWGTVLEPAQPLGLTPRKVREPSGAEMGAPQGANNFSGGWETLLWPLDWIAHVQRSGSLWLQCLGG